MANVILGKDTISGINVVKLKNADDTTQYIEFPDYDILLTDLYPSTYSVNVTCTNCLVNGASTYTGTIEPTTGTLTLNLTADGTSYALPESISVTGATGTYTRTNNTTGTLVLSNATADITLNINAVTTLPAPSNVTADGTTISFDPVDGATSYAVYADGTSIGEYTP